MHIVIEEPKCSQCGLSYSETYTRQDGSGRRCLNCGHDSFTPNQVTISYPPQRINSRHYRRSGMSAFYQTSDPDVVQRYIKFLEAEAKKLEAELLKREEEIKKIKRDHLKTVSMLPQ